MKINEVMNKTGLTRKAIYFYEEEGLINPAKDQQNSYRLYTNTHVNRLKQIKALRKLDIPLKLIKEILKKPAEFNNIMEKHLAAIRDKIDVLHETEDIIETLIKDNGNPDLFSSNLDRLNRFLELDAKTSADYMRRELERIFPNGFGKLMAIMYGAFLDEPIDSREKEQAWSGLINAFDAAEDVTFPPEINHILNELYNRVASDGLGKFEAKVEKIINNVSSFTEEITEDEKRRIEKRLETAGAGNDELIKMSRKLSEFIKENPNMLPSDFSHFLKILSSKYDTFSDNITKVFKSNLTIGKAFGDFNE